VIVADCALTSGGFKAKGTEEITSGKRIDKANRMLFILEILFNMFFPFFII
jgi:hypothetical protein